MAHNLHVGSLDTIGLGPVLHPHPDQTMEDSISRDAVGLQILDSTDSVAPDLVAEVAFGQLVEPPHIELSKTGGKQVWSRGAHTNGNLRITVRPFPTIPK